MPSVVVTTVGKKTISAQSSDDGRQAVAEPEHQQRGKRHRRDRLAGREIRLHSAAHQTAAGDAIAERYGDTGAQRETDETLFQRGERRSWAAGHP